MPKKKAVPKTVDEQQVNRISITQEVVEVKDKETGVASYVPDPPIKRVDDIFNTLYAIDVRPYVFQKGGYDYISWATAVKLLLQNYPLSDWTVTKHKIDIETNGNTVSIHAPYYVDQRVKGYMVEVQVTIVADDGQITRNETLPVINFRNQVIDQPDQMAVNKTIKRCLVKCLANMGLGLRLYEGDNADYSEGDEKDEKAEKSGENIVTAAKKVFNTKVVEAVNDNDCDYIKNYMTKKFPKSAKNRETYFKSVAQAVFNQYFASGVASPDELTPDECTKVKQHLMKG